MYEYDWHTEFYDNSALVALDKYIKLLVEAAVENEIGPDFYEARGNSIRIYTRESQNPMLNRNGGDYDFFTTFQTGGDGRLVSESDWSAGFDARDWGVYDQRVFGSVSLNTVRRLIEKHKREFFFSTNG